MSAVAKQKETIRAVIRFFYFADDDDRLELIRELENMHPSRSERLVIQLRMDSVAEQLGRNIG